MRIDPILASKVPIRKRVLSTIALGKLGEVKTLVNPYDVECGHGWSQEGHTFVYE